MADWYLPLKHIHVTCVVLTGLSFSSRAVMMLMDSALLEHKLVKVAPHVIDTVLLLSAIALAVALSQAPFVDGWLTAKVLALVAYVVLGALGLRRAKTKGKRAAFTALALMAYAYIVLTALTKSPTLNLL